MFGQRTCMRERPFLVWWQQGRSGKSGRAAVAVGADSQPTRFESARLTRTMLPGSSLAATPTIATTPPTRSCTTTTARRRRETSIGGTLTTESSSHDAQSVSNGDWSVPQSGRTCAARPHTSLLTAADRCPGERSQSTGRRRYEVCESSSHSTCLLPCTT